MSSLFITSMRGTSPRAWGVLDLSMASAARPDLAAGAGALIAPSAASEDVMLALVGPHPHVAALPAGADDGGEPVLLWLRGGDGGGATAGGPTGRTPGTPARVRASATGQWVVIDGALRRVKVNGSPLAVGLRVLTNRDEVTLMDQPGARLVFTDERPARVESISLSQGQRCARCQRGLAPTGAAPTPPASVLAVRCPSCGAMHHQDPASPCWTGMDDEPFATCAVCDYPAQLHGGFRWTPPD